MKVRPATREDALAILAIRNHPVSRTFSYEQNEISEEAHVEWFERNYAPETGNVCHVIETEHGVVGYCRLDRREGHYRVSIAVHPERHGRGLGSKLLTTVLKSLPLGTRLVAEVLPNNSASLAFFLKHGFAHIGRTETEDVLERVL